MTEEQIKQNAKEWVKPLIGEEDGGYNENSVSISLMKNAFTAGAHSRDEEIEILKHQLNNTSINLKIARAELDKLRNPWISVEKRLPEEEMDNISIPVVAITNNGYWFKGKYDYDNKEWFFSEDPDHLDFEVGEFVTHWMPIPQIEKGE